MGRLTFRLCFAVACASGEDAVRLGRAFRALGRSSDAWGPLPVLAQLPVVLLWAAARGIFLAAAAPCLALARSGAAG
jgi:hypothetical protein